MSKYYIVVFQTLCMDRLRAACEGKTATTGGLSIADLRNELVRRFPKHEAEIRSGTRPHVERLCLQLLAGTQPLVAIEQVFPPEILKVEVLPKLHPREARIVAFQKPSILQGLPLEEQCRILTEQKDLCGKKLVYTLPRLGKVDCTAYCFTVYQRIVKRAFNEMQALGAKKLEEKYGLPNDFYPKDYPIFGRSKEDYQYPAGSDPDQYVNVQTFFDYLADHINDYPESKEVTKEEIEDAIDAVALWNASDTVKGLAE